MTGTTVQGPTDVVAGPGQIVRSAASLAGPVGPLEHAAETRTRRRSAA